ncbi:hypothetical protein PMAYCL1PPCAC_20311, partial [Pristionchus mayeri]
DHDWAPIILDMFKGKLEELELLSSTAHRAYLTNESADILKEKLPTLEKKMWFSTHCVHYAEGLHYSIGEYLVEADGQFLTVAHKSGVHKSKHQHV